MSDGIFLIQGDGGLVEMTEQPYDSEALLQRLLAEYPSLLSGNQMSPAAPRRWLLVTREAGVASEQDGSQRWSVDHLFLDQDGIPTLIEVKRSADTRIRREVVGQMLDYAANAVVYWPVEQVRAYFATTCQSGGVDPEQTVLDFLQDPEADPERFWVQVKTNLEAQRVRMVFVADVIPPELRRIVEFLNAQMSPAEVLAVEIKQFAGQGLRTLVPRVMGLTAEAEQKKSAGRPAKRQWDEAQFLEAVAAAGSEAVAATRGLLAWAQTDAEVVSWGQGKQDGSFLPGIRNNGTACYPIAVYSKGRAEIAFQGLLRQPAFAPGAARRELRDRLAWVFATVRAA